MSARIVDAAIRSLTHSALCSCALQAIHLYTDDNENVRIIPRAQITEVDLIDTDHKTMKKIVRQKKPR
eukprot:6211049-Pleurochrysis_carterae.AAC.6